MQKATPLLLVLILALTALFLSLRTPPPEKKAPDPAPATSTTLDPETEPPTTKTDTSVAAVEPLPWPHESSDIPADPATIYGFLPNGLRYLIYPNQEPPARVSLRLHIAAGSLMEAEDQRGLAHFLEHMVFNGTKNHSAAELIPRMQRLGIAFGAHANAYTSFDETVYMLDLPDLSGETLDLAFTVMRDFGDGALLDPQEIEKERDVILSEKLSRDSVGYRLMQQQFEELLPESLLTKRFPIGTEEVIRTAPRERFVDFYTRYYTPARMTFIVVGDVNPEEIKQRIHSSFGGLKNPADPGADPDMGPIRPAEGLETAVFTDKEVESSDVSLLHVRPYQRRPDNRSERAARLPLELAHAMLSRRIERLAEEENSPVAGGQASHSALFGAMELGSIGITAADDRWEDIVPILEREFRRALEHGFTPAELEEARRNLLNAYEQAVRQKPTRRSEGLATALARSLRDAGVFSTPEENLAIATAALQNLTPASCHEAFRSFWDAPGHHLVLTTKELPNDQTPAQLAALYQESTGSRVEPPADRAIPVFAYDSFGNPGTILSDNTIPDLEIRQLVLSNQVRVNLKQTHFETGRIRLLARIGSGQLSQPPDSPMLDEFAASVFNGGGLGKHTPEDLRLLLAGRNAGTSLSIEEDAFSLGGSTTPADLPLQLRLMCAALTDPGWRNEGLWQFQKAVPMMFQQLRHTPAGPEREFTAWLHGGDSRYSLASMNQLAGYTIDQARAWLTPQLANGYLELSIIGDFDAEALLPELLATFGTLPTRETKPAPHEKERKILFPNAPANPSFTYQSKIEQGIAYSIWKTPGLRGNQKTFRRLNLLASILGDRLREEIRENLGASYSPNAGASGSDALDDFGFLLAQSVAKPEDLERLLDVMRDIAEKLALEGASADEFDRALQPTLGMLEKSLRDNSYWLGTVLSRSQAEPDRIEMARNRDADYRSITLAEINKLAARHLKPENQLRIRIRPETPAEP